MWWKLRQTAAVIGHWIYLLFDFHLLRTESAAVFTMKTLHPKVWSWDKIIRIRVVSHFKHLINSCFTVVIETHIPWREEHCERVEVINEDQTLQCFQSPVGCCCFTWGIMDLWSQWSVPSAVPGPDGALSPGPMLLMLRPDEGWCCSCTHLLVPWGPPAVTGPQTGYVPTPKK